MCVYTGVCRHISISLCNVITFIPQGWGRGRYGRVEYKRKRCCDECLRKKERRKQGEAHKHISVRCHEDNLKLSQNFKNRGEGEGDTAPCHSDNMTEKVCAYTAMHVT